MKMKKIISKILCFCGVTAVCVSSALPAFSFADNIYDDTRYNNSSPAQTVEDFLNGVSDGVVEAFNTGIDILADYYRQSFDPSSYTDPAQINDVFQKFIQFGADGLNNLVYAQRVKDLVDYANQSTTGLTTGQNVYAFIAKRKLLLGSLNGEQQYELDTMYFWKDNNHTENVDFTGVTIGNFFLQPNTFYVTRQFSNGDFDCFYGDVRQLTFNVSSQTGSYVNVPFTITFNAGQTYNVINSDGSISSLTFGQNSTGNTWSTLSFKILDNNLNAIDLDGFQRQMQYFPSAGQYISDGRLSNAQLMFNNATKSDGSMMRPNNYSGSAEGWGTWYLSSGSFLGNSNNSLTVAPRSFTTTNDPNNFDPRKPPASYNVDPLLLTDTQLSPQNVSNYNDYGISYNSTTNQFDLDIDALAAGIAGLISPDFKGNFDLVYDNQPGIGSSDWTNLDNNFNADFDTSITDISNSIESLLPSTPGWESPDFPPVTTYDIVVRPVMPTITQPIPEYLPTCASNLFGLADSILGGELLPLFVALALFGLAVGILM